MTSARRLHLAVADDLARLPESLLLVHRFGVASSLEPRRAHMVDLVAEELLTNVVRHGVAAGGTHSIEIDVDLRDEEVVIVVTDDGAAFDPLQAPRFDPDAPLEARRVGGMGIHLVRSVARHLSYRRDGDRNVLEVTL